MIRNLFTILAVSTMWCGSAAGHMLPPMVGYTAKNFYSGWTYGGICDLVYATTESGWFDSRTFHLWFEKCFLPCVQKNTPNGSKLLFGDNLVPHFNF